MKWTPWPRGFFAVTHPERDGGGYREWRTRLTQLAEDDSDAAVAALEEAAKELPWHARRLDEGIARAFGKRIESTPALRLVRNLHIRVGDPKLIMSVLRNPHLQQVRAVELWPRRQVSKIVGALLDSCIEAPSSVRFADARIDRSGLSALLGDARFAAVRTLGLEGANLKNAGFAWLAEQKLPNLEVLDLLYAADRISPKTTKALARAPFTPQLRSLHLGSAEYKAKEKAWLPYFEEADFSKMRDLYLALDLYDSDLERLAQRPLPELVSLRLQNPWEFSEAALVSFLRNAEMPSLRRLEISSVSCTDAIAQALLDAPWYEHLVLLSFAKGEGRDRLEKDGRLPLPAKAADAPVSSATYTTQDERW